MIIKYDIDPDDFYFANTLNTAAITALPEEVNGKNRLDSEKKLKSNLYLCIGDEAQRIFKARKGRRVPISLQDKVDKEIQRLINEGHIVKLQECSDKCFVSPIVITVKKDGSIKLALESRELN